MPILISLPAQLDCERAQAPDGECDAVSNRSIVSNMYAARCRSCTKYSPPIVFFFHRLKSIETLLEHFETNHRDVADEYGDKGIVLT